MRSILINVKANPNHVNDSIELYLSNLVAGYAKCEITAISAVIKIVEFISRLRYNINFVKKNNNKFKVKDFSTQGKREVIF